MIYFYFIIFFYFPLYIKNTLIPTVFKIGEEDNLLFPKLMSSTNSLIYNYMAINKTIIGYFNGTITQILPTNIYIEQNTRHISLTTNNHILANNKYVNFKLGSNYYSYNISSNILIDIPNDADPLIISNNTVPKFALVSLIYPSDNYLTKFLQFDNTTRTFTSNIENLSVCESSQTLKNIRCNNTIINSIFYSSCAAICDDNIYLFVLDTENMIKYTENIVLSGLSISNQIRIINFHFHNNETNFLVVSYPENKIFEIQRFSLSLSDINVNTSVEININNEITYINGENCNNDLNDFDFGTILRSKEVHEALACCAGDNYIYCWRFNRNFKPIGNGFKITAPGKNSVARIIHITFRIFGVQYQNEYNEDPSTNASYLYTSNYPQCFSNVKNYTVLQYKSVDIDINEHIWRNTSNILYIIFTSIDEIYGKYVLDGEEITISQSYILYENSVLTFTSNSESAGNALFKYHIYNNLTFETYINCTIKITINPCYSTCASCSQSSTSVSHQYCLTCKNGYYLSTSKNCQSCYEKCKTCSYLGNADENNCTSCFDNYFLNNDNNCYECNGNCSTCTNFSDIENNIGNCLTCKENYYMEYGTTNCYDETYIENGYYLSEEFFHRCGLNCKTCSGPADAVSNNCLTCDNCNGYYMLEDKHNCEKDDYPGYYLDGDILKKCHENCLTCSSGFTSTEFNCLTCKENYYKIKDTNKCYDSSIISEGYHLNSDNFWEKEEIVICYELCQTCINGENSTSQNCLSCIDNYHFIYNTLNCSNDSILYKYYLDSGDNKYHPCQSPCKTCNKTATNCLTCVDNYELNNNFCYEKCGSGKNLNNYLICVDDEIHTTKTQKELIDEVINTGIQNYISEKSIIKGDNFYCQIFPYSENVEAYITADENSLSKVYLNDCFLTLKNYYKIDNISDIILFKIDTNITNSSVNYVNYNVYHINGSQLDMNICYNNNKNITIIKPIINENIVNFQKAEYLSKFHIDSFDPTDNFFNDICFPFTNENNSDVIIKDRRDDYYQNISFCEKNCYFQELNFSQETIECSCNSSSNDFNNLNFDNIKSAFISEIYPSNIFVVKCYKLFFSIKYIKKNLGWWILLSIIIIEIIIFLIFIYYGFKQITIILLIYQPKNDFNDEKNNKNNNLLLLNNNKLKKKLNDSKGSNEKNPPKKKLNLIDSYEFESSINDNESNKNSSNKIDENNYKLNPNNLQIIRNRMDSNLNLIRRDNSSNKINKINIKPKNSSKKHVLFFDNYDINKNIERKNSNNIQINKNLTSKSLFLKRTQILDIDEKSNKSYKTNKIYFYDNIDYLKSEKIDLLSNKSDDNNINNSEKEEKLKNKNFSFLSYDEIFNLNYEESLEYESRTFFQIYWWYLSIQHIIINTFIAQNFLEFRYVNIFFFFESIALEMMLNALFYDDAYINEIYKNEGILDFISSLPKSIYSFLVTFLINFFLVKLSNSKAKILNLIKNFKNKKDYEIVYKNILKNLKIKIAIFFIISFFLLLFYFYYCGCFCAVYYNNQLFWLYGTLISFSFNLILPFITCFISSILRYISIYYKCKCLFNILKIFNFFL